MPEHEKRHLTTILVADVAGYSGLMAVDEAGTYARVRANVKELFEPKASEYRGRVVKLLGDGVLMEFDSVVDAARFAAELQRESAARNATVDEDRRVTYRIGINVGDIIVDGDDIYGDGVNVAARLQEIAEPGAVYVSGHVYGQNEGKVDLGFEDLGERRLKNIPHPVRVLPAGRRQRAVDSRGRAAPPAPVHEAALARGDGASRPAAVAAIARVGGKPAGETLKETIKSGPSEAQVASVLAIVEMRGDCDDCAEFLREQKESNPDAGVRDLIGIVLELNVKHDH